MNSTTKKLKFAVVSVIVAAGAIAYTLVTRDEQTLIENIQSEVRLGRNELDLSKMMPGQWELVCDSDGYDGPLYLKQYNRTYQPVGAAQDGAWGLIFINKDGSYKSASGTRLHGFDFDFGCMKRGEATLTRKNGGDVWIDGRSERL